VVFEVEEGEPTVVRKIFFIGNKHFSHSKLETAIQTKETRWYRFFTSDDSYDPDRVAYDRELLRKYYLERGYADFVVKSAVAELSPDQKEFFITFTLFEGERYKVGRLGLKSNLKDVNVDSFQKHLTFKEGEWYSSKEIDRTISHITDALGAKGFAFVDVRPEVQKNDKDQTIDILFEINEGPKAYIDRITIIGNDRTDEAVIRRELRFYEGDPFNAHNQKISKQRLENLGFFKKVDIRREPSNAPDKLNIVIEVDEERTGEISIGGGYSTADGILGNINFLERNFRGKGQEFGMGLTVAKRRQEFDINFTEPYFLDRELSAGVDLYRLSQSKFFGDSFTQKTYGGALRMGYMLAEYLSQSWAYRLSFDELTGVRSDASKFIKEQQGRSTLSGISHGLMYDRRDNRFEPTSGYTLSMNNDFAGAGGNVKYLRTKFGASYYYPLLEDVIYGLSGSYGYIQKIGSRLRIIDRFSLGDESLRGFQMSGLGPRDKATKDPLGGIHYYSVTNEVVFPTPLPTEFNLKMAGFVDAGCVWKTPEPASEVIDSKKLRASAGVGLRWKSPLGPIAIDFAQAIRKDKDDKTQLVHFRFSTRF
jgi:outer membrane protein insertion porin family